MKARLALFLLAASGHAGAAGPRLSALCARVADSLGAAAHRVSPLTECPGCGAAVPGLALEGVGVCEGCQEREDAAPPVHPPGDFDPAWFEVAGGPRVNVTRYHHRANEPTKPS